MGKKSYDVFISYRREGGLDFARSIAYYLRIEGYQCFLDQRELKTGQFNSQIYEAIENSKYFLSVLTHGALDRCAEPGDWVRKEIEHALQCGVTVIPVAVRGEKLVFPDSLPDSLAILKSAQASFIDRETDFEETIVKMLRNQMKLIDGMSTVQHRRMRRQAEKVFLKKAGRFKGNDGVINDNERMELERLASACGISRNRLEELVEKVEAAAARRARIVAWMKNHPWSVAAMGLFAAGLLFLVFLGVVSMFSSPQDGQGGDISDFPVNEAGALEASEKSARKIGVKRDLETASKELEELDSNHRYDAESDFRASIGNGSRRARTASFSELDEIGKRIATEYETAAAEGRKLSSLGMEPHELIESRPDLVMLFADIRSRVESDIKKLVRKNRHEEALNYYNSAKKAFEELNMCTLDRPSFSK